MSPSVPNAVMGVQVDESTVALVMYQVPLSNRPGVATPSPFQSASSGTPAAGGIDMTVVVSAPGSPDHMVHRPDSADPAAGIDRMPALPTLSVTSGREGSFGALPITVGKLAAGALATGTGTAWAASTNTMDADSRPVPSRASVRRITAAGIPGTLRWCPWAPGPG